MCDLHSRGLWVIYTPDYKEPVLYPCFLRVNMFLISSDFFCIHKAHCKTISPVIMNVQHIVDTRPTHLSLIMGLYLSTGSTKLRFIWKVVYRPLSVILC